MAKKVKEFEKHVVVLGGGAAGIAAALALNDLGFKVSLIDKNSHLLGTFGQLDKQFPNDACGFCQLRSRVEPGVSELCLRRDLGAEGLDIYNLSTLWNVEKLKGERLKLYFNQEPAYIEPDLCVRCRKCEDVCPVDVPDEFNILGKRKAAYTLYPMAVPSTWVIDGESCTSCGECVKVCPTDCIDLAMQPREISLEADAVVIATGFALIDPSYLTELGVRFPNVVTSLELERILSGFGPTQGELKRPSDGSTPKKVAFVFCAGSRDRLHPYCSSACCMYGAKEARMLGDKYPDTEITIFYMDRRGYGKPYYSYMEDTLPQVCWIPCRPAKVEETEGNDLLVHYESEDGKFHKEEFDLVTLVVGQEGRADDFAKLFDLETNQGFIKIEAGSEIDTVNPRVFAIGSAGGPKDLPDSITEAQAAAGRIASLLGISKKSAVPSRSVEPFPKVGIVFDPVGDGGVGLDQDLIKTFFASKGIEAAFINYTETEKGLAELGNFIREKELDRLVVAGPAPNKAERILKQKVIEMGWHPAQLEYLDFREPVLWGYEDASKFNEAALTLALAHAEKLRLLSFDGAEPVQPFGRALIVGAGTAGLWAARQFADVGVSVTIIEKTEQPGGQASKLTRTLEGFEAKPFLDELIKEVKKSKKIELLTNATLDRIEGELGKFTCHLKRGDEELIRGAATILFATGAEEYQPKQDEFGWGLEGVISERDFAGRISKGETDNLKSVVMIQCVGSRNEEHPYCSRVCCRRSLTNAIALKERDPKIEVTILAQDVMSWGLSELYFLKARDLGVNFIRYEKDNPPTVSMRDGKLVVSVYDRLLDATVELSAGSVVLAKGIVASAPTILYNDKPLEFDEFGFFAEVNPKFRTVELEVDGMFAAGLAKGPKRLTESLTEASAAVAKALVFLRREKLAPKLYVARTNTRRCAFCGICIDACPNSARVMDDDLMSARVIEAICQGCGICAGACPSQAAHLLTLESDQAFRMIDVMLTQTERGIDE